MKTHFSICVGFIKCFIAQRNVRKKPRYLSLSLENDQHKNYTIKDLLTSHQEVSQPDFTDYIYSFSPESCQRCL